MSKITWIGDSDPNAQSIEQFGYQFVKGEPVEVKDKKVAEKLATNPLFSTEKVAPAAADEPDSEELAARAEEGTEKAALKAQLRDLGVEIKGNPSIETLRNKLVEALAK